MINIQIPARVDYSNQPVLTTEQLAEFYGCDKMRLIKNFNNNRDRFTEGVHYFKLEGDALKDLRIHSVDIQTDMQISPMTRTLYLWTKQGAFRHAKMLSTDRAWEVYELLEANYFNGRANVDWLPAITHGGKVTPDLLRQIANALEVKDAKIAAQEIQIAELTPKANYYDKVLNCGGLLTTTDIAKDYRMSAVKFNRLLARLGVQFRRGGRWYLYQKYARLGWSSTRTYLKNGSLIVAKTHMCWTQAGKRGLYNLLKEYGFAPASELPSLFD